jgi:exopolysaccharide production protein ExoQ
MKYLAPRHSVERPFPPSPGPQTPIGNRKRQYPALTLLPLIGAVLFFGAAIAVLGISSGLMLAVVIAALVLLVLAAGILWAGIAGKPWAYSVSLFLVAVIMEGTVRRSDDIASTQADTQTLLKLVIWSGAMLMGIANYARTMAVIRRIPGLKWLGLFSAWALISTVYSLTPAYTFGGGFAFLTIVVFVSASADRLGPDHLIMPMIYACGVLTVSAVVMYFVAPSLVVSQMEGGKILRLAGLTGSPNNLGRVAAISLILLFFAVRQGKFAFWRPDLWILAAAGLICLHLSWSRTSAVALCFALVAVVLRRRLAVLFIFSIASLLALMAALLIDVDWNALARVMSRRGSIEELTTATGRTAIWEYSWRMFLQNPLIGYGFGATKQLIPSGFYDHFGWTTISTHNMALQALVTTGLVGGALMLSAVLWQISAIFRAPCDLPDALFYFVMVSGLFEAGAAGVAPNMLTMIWVMSMIRESRSTTAIEHDRV